MKSAAGMTASPDDFAGFADRPSGALLGSRRRVLMIGGLLCLAILAAAAPGWLTAPAKLSFDPLSGNWSCSLAGEPIGTLSADGLNYVLASNAAGEPAAGTLERIVYGKYREEYLKVQSGPLKDQFGSRIGYHYHLANKPEALVFNIGPGSGIRCVRG